MTETMTETLPACDIPFEPFPVEDSALETIVSAIVEKKLSEGLASDVKKSVMLYTRNVVTATANAFRDNVELGLKRLSALEKQTKELRALTGKKRKQSGLVEQLRRKNGTLQAEVARLKKKAEMRSLQIKVLKDGKKKRKVLQEPPPPKKEEARPQREPFDFVRSQCGDSYASTPRLQLVSSVGCVPRARQACWDCPWSRREAVF